MQERQTKAPALLSTITSSLWLALALLPGLVSIAYAQKNAYVDTSLPTNTVTTENVKLIQQRKLYLQAQKAFKKAHYTTFKRISSLLEDYPLYPYLEYKSLIRKLNHKQLSLSGEQINNFLQTNDDTVIGNRFRLKLIKHAARKHNWLALIDVYRPGFGKSADCHYLNALIQTKQQTLAYPRIENMWLSSHSQPNTCDPVFRQWQAAGLKTPELIWQRFKLAILAGNRQLAGFLMSSMPNDDASVARKWLKAHKDPKFILSTEITTLKHPDQASIILHGLKKMSYRDINSAIEIYHKLDKYPFTPSQLAEINRRFGLQLARDHMPDAGLWLARVPQKHTNKQVQEWKIRTAIRQGDWSFVLKAIAQLTPQQQSSYRWQYWWAYANEQMGNTIDAHGIYQYLASKRSYYGFLAADHLNLQYAFENRPVEPTVETMSMINQQAETQRAREFYAINQQLPARREWHRLINRINTEQKLAASKLAQAWGWHDRAIVTMGRTFYRDDIELRFPLFLENKVNNWSSKNKIEAAWTYAIMRRESAFMQDARSPVGAMGLMQLMPNTARAVARQMNVRYRGRSSLLASNTNIRLGTGYLKRMLDKLNSQHVLATAAYNAGPHRVSKWLPEHHQMDAIRWIETIPFTETREYVSNVLAYMVIYEHRMNHQTIRLSQRMPPIPAKNPHPTLPANSEKQTAQALPHSQKDPS